MPVGEGTNLSWCRGLARPMEGVTTDGIPVPGLFPLHRTGVDTSGILYAATALLRWLSTEESENIRFPIDSDQWRTWLNVHMNFFRHGIMLEDLSEEVRELALDVLRATLSVRGFEQARNIMAINEPIAQLSGQYDSFGEWPYFLSIFGEPALDKPWGWQIDGHHLNVNCVIIGDQLVMTPTFMGSEPRTVQEGSLAGTELFTLEEEGRSRTRAKPGQTASANGNHRRRRFFPAICRLIWNTHSMAARRPGPFATTPSCLMRESGPPNLGPANAIC
jgi:hypothetical protein